MAKAGQLYTWQGVDRQGHKAQGELSSATPALAKAALRRQGIRPTRVRRKTSGLNLMTLGARVTGQDLALFTRQLAAMMKAGVPLVQSFELVAQGVTKPVMKSLILKLRDEVASGNSFTQAVAMQPAHFDDLYRNLVAAGEQSGTLDTMLARLATCKEKAEALKARIRSALLYPAAVLLVAGLVTGVLLVKVIPQFEETFAGFNAELPEATRLVVALSHFMQDAWLACTLGLAGLLIIGREAYRRSQAVREHQQRLLLKLPLLGKLANQSCTARFARTLATTFAAGVPLVDALGSVAGATGNVVYAEAVTRIRDEVSTGVPLSQAMRHPGIFPDMVVQLVAIGEESGTLDTMLEKAASHYEDSVDNAVAGLASLVEPLMMLLLGGIIGGLIIAMYLPIFSMGDAFGGIR